MDLTRRLAEGVGAWLHFEYLCQRGGLFDERYLSFAVGQILSSQFGESIHGEFTHPVIAPLMTGSGRRPAIDFVCCKKYPDVSLAVETKWAGSSHTTAESILWDLIRLEMIASRYSAECIFLLAGRKADLTKLFKKLVLRDPSGSPGHVTHIVNTRKNVMHGFSFLPHPRYKVSLLRKLFKDVQDVQLPHRIMTRRASPFPVDCPTRQYQVYAWNVTPVAKREEFRPRAIPLYRQ